MSAGSIVGARPNVEYLGRVSETQVVNEYQEATAFVLPSLYDGYVLPAIEAQKCGCPVIASDAAAIPETLRESADYFDPLSTAEISRSIERVLLDRDLQSRLITLGLANASKFSWKDSAQRVDLPIAELQRHRRLRLLRSAETSRRPLAAAARRPCWTTSRASRPPRRIDRAASSPGALRWRPGGRRQG